MFTRTTDLVQKLQIARRDLALEAAIAKLDKYQGPGGNERSLRTNPRTLRAHPSANGVKIFPDQAMTLAAIDRLVHHATILEMNVDSYRRKEAIDKARGVGRPPTRATIKASS